MLVPRDLFVRFPNVTTQLYLTRQFTGSETRAFTGSELPVVYPVLAPGSLLGLGVDQFTRSETRD